MNDEQAVLGLLHGRLQNNLNELIILFSVDPVSQDDFQFIKHLLRAQAVLLRNQDSQKIFSALNLRPLQALLTIIQTQTDTEVVVNGLSCINQAFSNQEVLGLVNKEFKGVTEIIESIKSKHRGVEQIGHECN